MDITLCGSQSNVRKLFVLRPGWLYILSALMMCLTKFDFPKNKDFGFPKFGRYSDYANAFVRDGCLCGLEFRKDCS